MKQSGLFGLLVFFCFAVFGQADMKPVYLGAIKGTSAAEFDKVVGTKNKRWNDYYGLPPITASRFPFEVRLYKITPYWHGTCTILFMDTVLKMTVAEEQNEDSCVEEDPSLKKVQTRISPQIAFQQLIENAIFSMPGKFTPELYVKVSPKAFDSSQIVSAPFWVVSDGDSFLLEYKVGNVFNYSGFRTPKTNWENYPDNQLYRRQTGIVNAMMCLYNDCR